MYALMGRVRNDCPRSHYNYAWDDSSKVGQVSGPVVEFFMMRSLLSESTVHSEQHLHDIRIVPAELLRRSNCEHRNVCT